MADSQEQSPIASRFARLLDDRRFFLGWVALIVGSAMVSFCWPAFRLTRPLFPAPLDDTYIYFDFARTTARGSFLAWSEGTGYSSGATSVPYALVLSLGYLLGWRGGALGYFAIATAFLSLVGASVLLDRAFGRAVGFIAPLVLVGIPLAAWSLFSGMELSLFTLAIAGTMSSLAAVRAAWAVDRTRAQRRAGLWLCFAVATRPEAITLAPLFILGVLEGRGGLPLFPSLVRSLAPAASWVGGYALLNSQMTGEAQAAGAVRKLVWTNPYASPAETALVVLQNLIRVFTEGVEMALGGRWAFLGWLLLGALGLTHRRTRWGVLVLLSAALGWLCLVAFNTTAPFQNLRYVVPVLTMISLAALHGIHAALQVSRVRGALSAFALLVLLVYAQQHRARQIAHFASASKNILEQQIAVGRRLADGKGSIFLGDAGAIPYFADRPGLDGLGLGGHHDLPFARASVHGEGAILELIQRIPPEVRPTDLAIYDSWFPGIARFGERRFDVTIDDNVICGAPTKSVYSADWTPLDEAARVHEDEIDLADLISEREHSLTFSRPHVGYVVFAVRRDNASSEVFDAGRVFPSGASVSFSVRAPAGRLALRARVVSGVPRLVVRAAGSSSPVAVVVESAADDRWSETPVALGSSAHRLTFDVEGGAVELFHVWAD